MIVFSLFFYAWGEPIYVLLMAFSAFMNYLCGRLIGASKSSAGRKGALVLAIVVDLGALAFFKYTGFLFENLNAVTGLSFTAPQVIMPIGISFYTFQALTYVIDVYRDQVPVQQSYARFLLYIALFPQLIAGPIVRYSEIEPQLSERTITGDGLFLGLTRFCIGLGKKVLIANYCGAATSELLGGSAPLGTVGAWLGVLLYAFQIYFDFSGYSDMAIGMGRMFGFRYAENFNLPYISKSITEFWRRWHISLSSFFRDYIYIPLGGNRRHRTLNLLVVWALTGLWHGASWNFVLWGLYFFVLLVLEKLMMPILEKIPAVLRHLGTLVLILFGWTLFYFTDLSQAGQAFSAMLGFGAGFCDMQTRLRLTASIPLLIVAALGSTPLPRTAAMLVQALCAGGGRHASRRSMAFYVLTFVFDVALIVITTVSLVGSSYNPFLYFRF